MQQPIPPGRRWFHFDRARRLIRRFPADVALFFLLYYLYAWLVVDPRLIWGYHQCSRGLLFTSDWPFLGASAPPGGAIEYLARLLYQFYRFGWAGALIMTAAAWAACLGPRRWARRRPELARWRYVPAAILLMAYGGYLPILGLILALLAGLWCFVLYERVAPEGCRETVVRVPARSRGRSTLRRAGPAVCRTGRAVRASDSQASVDADGGRCGAAGLWLVNWLLGVSFRGHVRSGSAGQAGHPAEQGLYALALLAFFRRLGGQNGRRRL